MKLNNRKRTIRIFLLLFFTTVIVVCGILSNILKSETGYSAEKEEFGKVENQVSEIKGLKSQDTVSYSGHNELLDSLNITGSMILNDVAEKYNVPVEYIMGKLDIPESESTDKKVGLLRRKYDFRMDDIKEIIHHYKNWE